MVSPTLLAPPPDLATHPRASADRGVDRQGIGQPWACEKRGLQVLRKELARTRAQYPEAGCFVGPLSGGIRLGAYLPT